MNTCFKRKDTDTWLSSGEFAYMKTTKALQKKVKSYRGASVDSDHYLLRLDLGIKNLQKIK